MHTQRHHLRPLEIQDPFHHRGDRTNIHGRAKGSLRITQTRNSPSQPEAREYRVRQEKFQAHDIEYVSGPGV